MTLEAKVFQRRWSYYDAKIWHFSINKLVDHIWYQNARNEKQNLKLIFRFWFYKVLVNKFNFDIVLVGNKND